jgi:hypothetical protein
MSVRQRRANASEPTPQTSVTCANRLQRQKYFVIAIPDDYII